MFCAQNITKKNNKNDLMKWHW